MLGLCVALWLFHMVIIFHCFLIQSGVSVGEKQVKEAQQKGKQPSEDEGDDQSDSSDEEDDEDGHRGTLEG